MEGKLCEIFKAIETIAPVCFPPIYGLILFSRPDQDVLIRFHKTMKPVYMIVACAENRVIGKEGGGLPWSIPEDTAYWKEKVTGGIMIEGRKCFEELGGPFPDTDTIVLSRNPEFSPGNALTALSLPLALELAQGLERKGPIWICGGPSLYREGMPVAEKLYLTLVHAEVDGVAFFPDWRSDFTVELDRRDSSDENYSYSFLVLGRAENL